jgi:HK97 family phage major capsid protein
MTNPFITPDAEKAFAMDVKGVAPKDLIADALVIQCSTKAGNVEGDAPAVRVPYVSFEDQPDFVAEGDPIDEADPDDSEVVIYTGKVAILVPVSREQWGQEEVANLLSEAAKDALVRKANRAFLSQAAPVGPVVTPPAGIVNQSIEELLTSVAAALSLDPLIDAVAHIEAAGGVPSHILMHPLGWALLQKLKLDDSTSNASLLGAGTTSPTRQLLNVPVLVDKDAPVSAALVLDKRSILSVYGNVQVATSDDAYFSRDARALRATFRFGAKVANPDRVVLVPLTDES